MELSDPRCASSSTAFDEKATQELFELISIRNADEHKLLHDIINLIKEGADITARDRKNKTPLHWITHNNYLKILTFFLTRYNLDNFDSNILGPRNLTPLHYACIHSNTKMVQLLLNIGADPYCNTLYKQTAFDLAIYAKKTDVLYTLICHSCKTLKWYQNISHLKHFINQLSLESPEYTTTVTVFNQYEHYHKMKWLTLFFMIAYKLKKKSPPENVTFALPREIMRMIVELLV
jgi:hypothetical protein